MGEIETRCGASLATDAVARGTPRLRCHRPSAVELGELAPARRAPRWGAVRSTALGLTGRKQAFIACGAGGGHRAPGPAPVDAAPHPRRRNASAHAEMHSGAASAHPI